MTTTAKPLVPALLDHRGLPRRLRAEDLVGRPADLRPEQRADLEPDLPAEVMREQHTLCEVVPFLERPGDPERHRVAVPNVAVLGGGGHARRNRSTPPPPLHDHGHLRAHHADASAGRRPADERDPDSLTIEARKVATSSVLGPCGDVAGYKTDASGVSEPHTAVISWEMW